jgi:protein TonB
MIRAGRFLCETDRPYRRTLSVTLTISLAIHFLILLMQPFAWWKPREARTAGLQGPDRAAPEITTEVAKDSETESQRARRAAAEGTFLVLNIEIVPDESPRPTRPVERPVPEPRPAEIAAAEPEISGHAAPEEEEPVIELGEDLAPRTSSASSTLSEQFAILRLVTPEYPELSILQNVEGRIWVRALVDREGEVAEIDVVESGVDLFCENAVKTALQQWRFRPYRRHGRAVPFTVLIPFRFQLED